MSASQPEVGGERSGRLHLLVNPEAGRGRAGQVAQAVEDTLRAAGWGLRVTRTLSPAHAEQLAGEAAPGDVVAMLSGDGLMARVAAGALRSGATIAPLPGGRANDLVALLGIPANPVTAASRLHLAAEQRLDVGLVNGRAFLGVASVGFDSLANEEANRTRWLVGPLVYAYGALRALLRFRLVRFQLEVDGQPQTLRGWDVIVGNSGRYGGGMKICPQASLSDGVLDVLTIGEAPHHEFFGILGRVFQGTHVQHPCITASPARRVRLDADQPLHVYADGDIIAALPCEVTILPGAVRVLV